MNNANPMKVLLSVVDAKYPNSISVDEIIRHRVLLKSTIKLAKMNGLYYYFILRLRELNIDIDKECWNDELYKLSKLRNTMLFLNSMQYIYGIEYILIKACTEIPHVPRDIDILVHTEDTRRIFDVLDKNGMVINYSNNVETSFEKNGYMKLDIYEDVRYMSKEFIDKKFLWDSNIEGNISGVKCTFLKHDANFLLLLIHSIFGHRKMTLLDFINMKCLLDNMRNTDNCRKYAYDNGWGSVFEMGLEKLRFIYDEIYKYDKIISFPYLFDKNFILECISSMNLNMTIEQKRYISISLMLDSITHNLEKIPFYDSLLYLSTCRRMFNYLAYFIRDKRGDRHGLKEKNVNR